MIPALRPSSPSPGAAASNAHITNKIPKEAVHLRSALPLAIPAALHCKLRGKNKAKTNADSFPSPTPHERVLAFGTGKPQIANPAAWLVSSQDEGRFS